MTTAQLAPPASIRPAAGSASVGRTVVIVGSAVALAAVVAYLVASGLWFVAVAALMAIPVFVLIHRVPLAAIGIWLLIDPLLIGIGGGVRPIFWAVHRALPLGVLALLVLSGMFGLRSGSLSRLGWPEVMMAGYVVVTLVSIAYTSDTPIASSLNLYDRVMIPMALYLIVRLMRPGESALRAAVPIVAAVLLVQLAIGVASWAAPGVLPGGWTGRAGERTTGSLSSPSVYGVTLIAAGAFLFHAAVHQPSRPRRVLLTALSVAAFAMSIFTYTRGVWGAAAVAILVLAFAYPRQVRRLALLAVPVLVVLLLSGVLGRQISTLEQRFSSEETALARLPLAYAALNMFEDRPVTGFGYGNFDKFDRDYQRVVNDFIPEKDHSSHNLYLTLLAEQGLPGAGLYLAPALWWLAASAVAYRRLPWSGFISRKLLLLMWAVLVGHFVVNNFSNMRIVFGLGQWWLILGLIAAILTPDPDRHEVSGGARPGALTRIEA